MKYMLDTHVWIWWNMHPQKLSTRVRSLLSTPEQYDSLFLSAISPWEFSKLLEKKRIGISCNTEEWIAEALDMQKLQLIPLTPSIAYHSTSLPQPFNGDPADQIIVATAREENAAILTKDIIIQKYKHVRSLW